jgi:Protein of unknown function (DUF1553)
VSATELKASDPVYRKEADEIERRVKILEAKNRMWAHHFGQGIVKSVGNFGRAGGTPSHPELLDWLAMSFVKNNWSMKAVHRLMVTSTAYRQRSALSPELEKADPYNQLVSRMPLQRLDAEALNDTMALVAGRLDERRFGRPDPVLMRDDGLVEPIEGEMGWRRSIYMEQRRSQIPSVVWLRRFFLRLAQSRHVLASGT